MAPTSPSTHEPREHPPPNHRTRTNSTRLSIPQTGQHESSQSNQLTESPTSIHPPVLRTEPNASQQREPAAQDDHPSSSSAPGPLRTRLLASQTFAEGMAGSIQSLRKKALERMNSHMESRNVTAEGSSSVASGHSTGAARPVMPRSRPSMTQFRMRDQPSKMIIPPPYGEEMVQEAAKALAAGIPDGIRRSNTIHAPAARVLSDSESASSDDEPAVRVHFEIHLQEDADSEPICPLNEKNVATLTEELDLSAQERTEVEAIQTKEELAAYFEKIPRDYDVQIIVADHTPESPGVTFAQDDYVLNGESIAVVRRESISSFKEKKVRRKKQRYRRPTTDLSTMPIQEPKASWLELFYDLLFVANLTEFTHNHPITGEEALAHYIGWFVIMWWAWAGQTFWASRYDMDDLFTKLLKLIEFCALISFGAFSSDHLYRTSTGFIGSYIVLKGILVIEYGNVLFWARRNRSKKSLTPLWLQIGSNALAMVIWGLSILVHSMAWRYVMWYSTIVIEVAVLVSFGGRTSVTFAGSHLPERFALFTIIVLGENVIGLIGLSAGASAWERGYDSFLILFLFTTVILYSLWWLYFDDFSEDIFHKTTTLSQLWAYLHLPLHVCIVLVGTGALDLIRLYKEEHHIKDMTTDAGHMVAMGMQSPSLDWSGGYVAMGFEAPIDYRSAAGTGSGGSLAVRPTDYNLTKQYFLIVCSLVFLCNSLLKWINLRSYDRFQKIVYLSRFLNAICILCLLAVPLEKMTPFALLGSMAFFCILQVAVDLAVIYFGAYGFVDDLEAWAKSARSSIDLGSFLPSPLGGRSRANSRAGSVVNLSSLAMGGKGSKMYNNNDSTTSLVNLKGMPSPKVPTSYFPHQQQQYQHHQQQQLSVQQQGPTLSQQQQQALYNMHVNANSLGSSGAYGNLVQALAEIKRREALGHSGSDTALGRQLSLRGTERGSSTSAVPRRSSNSNTNAQLNSVSLKRPGVLPVTGGGASSIPPAWQQSRSRPLESNVSGTTSSSSTSERTVSATTPPSTIGRSTVGGAVGLSTMFEHS
ncbi:hypothetical protein BGZ68_007868 [Mortierella alpina]|nr:hypothetical protein BGZ68_007868 [Mortierella alpina]